MELKQLRSLITLADSGSIVSTAEKLHLSPAAIHKLEAVPAVQRSITLLLRLLPGFERLVISGKNYWQANQESDERDIGCNSVQKFAIHPSFNLRAAMLSWWHASTDN